MPGEPQIGQQLQAGEAGLLGLDPGDQRQGRRQREAILDEAIVDPQAPALRIELEAIEIVYEAVPSRAYAAAQDEVVAAGAQVELALEIDRLQRVAGEHI